MRADGKALYSLEEANTLASSLGAQAYMECSARGKIGVDEVFLEATKVAYKGAGGGCCIIM